MFTKGSLNLGKYAGIPLKVHWTFSFIFLFVIGLGLSKNREWPEIGIILVLVAVSFFCVTLHEYGHALMAKRFKVKTIDIILSPIGGLARLERLPDKPIQEFLIAIAGPLVNVAIGLVIALVLLASGKTVLIDLDSSVSNLDNWGAYLSLVLYINLLLFLFNLIPAFPMDGGRILRSLLSMKLGKRRSTDIASWIGYIIALGFIIVGFFISYYTLSIIGVFVMVMARGEKVSARQEDFLTSNDASLEGLMSRHRFLPETPMEEILAYYKRSEAKNFMIFSEEDELLGVVTEPAIKAYIEKLSDEQLAPAYTEPNFPMIDNTNLQAILSYMNNNKARFVVIKGENLGHGILERSKIVKRMNMK